MRFYLDDDAASPELAGRFRKAGHDVQVPRDVGLPGQDDAVHLTHAIRQDRVCISYNYGDFENLHNLIMAAKGHHPGILVIRRDNDPTRDPTPRGIAKALANLLASRCPVTDQYQVLNQWR